MNTEQRRALEGTIPTTEVIKDAVTYPRERLGEPLDISPERFEAWLAQVRRDAARDALDGLIAHVEKFHAAAQTKFSEDTRDIVAGWTEGFIISYYPEDPS